MEYHLPKSLLEYLSTSRTIQERVNEKIVADIEDNYLRFKHFYQFSEEQFAELTVDALNYYKTPDTFNYLLNKTLKDKLQYKIKNPIDSEEFQAELEKHINKELFNMKSAAVTTLSKELVNSEKNFDNAIDYFCMIGKYSALNEILSLIRQEQERIKTLDQELEDFFFKSPAINYFKETFKSTEDSTEGKQPEIEDEKKEELSKDKKVKK
jgi:hypothetical protein